MTISNQEVNDSLRNDMVGGNSFVIHRENIAGKTQIHKFRKHDQQIISYELPHTVENIICLDFNSFYGSCMSSEQQPLIPYTNHRMYMPGGVKYIIHDQDQAKYFIFNKHRFSSDEDIINKNVHLFIAKVNAHIPYEYINEFINFPVIWRNLKIITDKDTVAHIEGNKGEELKNKLEVNTSFGYDSINSEKYKDFRLCNKKNVWKHHMANTFLTDKQFSENCFIVELEKKRCSCSTPLQVAYFTMDNSKYFYLNAYYNFLTAYLDMDYIHVIYGDTDSLCLAIAHESWPIKDKKLWDQLYSQLFPSSNNDTDSVINPDGSNYYDKKKILGWNIESESTTCLALAPNLKYPFKSKIEHFKKLHGKSLDKIQDIPPDYQIKPLSKLNRPYFSSKLGSMEIDLVFSMDERIIRANQIYLFCIIIYTKYLAVSDQEINQQAKLRMLCKYQLRIIMLLISEVMERRDLMEVY
ncbi:MAG: hypothetical protein EZS28_025855 [Streblomastix strix]|uniref:Uncharacterized protein n=1 Tax=Streblomastix strix TaxID=222440 RepID=A0A5J4V7H3_9EUKA|nr:MAG: hypothetical protein EZS28_025855 [Streblomastix strix]